MPSNDLNQARLLFRRRFLDRLERVLLSPDCSEAVKKILKPIFDEGEDLEVLVGGLGVTVDKEDFQRTFDRWSRRLENAWDKALDVHGRDLPL